MNLRWITGAAAAAMLVGFAVVYKFPPREYSFYPQCPFYAATHWLCPGCGSTRALYAMLHMDWRGALHYNAMFTLLAPLAVAWFVFCCYRVMRYDRLPRLQIPRGVVVGLACAVVLFAVARNTLFTF